MPLTRSRSGCIVTAGPSVLSVGQTLVTDVQFAETFPYDTAEFTGATTTNATASAAGFNAGADVFWMFSRHVGAGGLVQFTRARAGASTPAADARSRSTPAARRRRRDSRHFLTS